MKYSIALDDWYYMKSIECVDCTIDCKRGCEYCECPLLSICNDEIDRIYKKGVNDD